ncbi:hypothetical protein ACOJR9_02585 [Alteromonas sp. A081]|uniref:hypothetical protein n=1 Tax=Alteromonas sp. A081 TaxID=3410269 RepID=UPI003B97DD79
MKFVLCVISIIFSLSACNSSVNHYSQRGGGYLGKELCNPTGGQCHLVGSGAGWLLSIFETSIKACKKSGFTSPVVNHWFEDNTWLVQQVKDFTDEYSYLLQLQDKYWAVPEPYLTQQCREITELVSEQHPLNKTMR